MTTEQKLREALRETLLFCETFSNRWDGETGAHPFGMVERARQALATTEPEPTWMPELPSLPRCMYQNMQHQRMYIGNVYTADQVKAYGEQCWKAGYKQGAWGDKPAVNQQLATEPFDEREAFEKWCAQYIYTRPAFQESRGGYVAPDVWAAWQARAAMTKGVKG